MTDLHGDETYKEASPLEDAILKMQEEIDDLRWRMNALCNHLSLQEEARRTFK